MSPSATFQAIPIRAMTARRCLVLGGARSGKSRFAEELVADRPGHQIYLATAQAGDREMAERIRRHRERRGESWHTLEEPLELAGALLAHGRDGAIILVDCLTLWLSNLMGAGRDPERETRTLVDALRRVTGDIVLVSNEVGHGIVPDNALARAFRDHAGLLNQAVAAAADQVYFVTAGLPMALKDTTETSATSTSKRTQA
ncbi:MAG: bifunctional adenosylcobinamide kinase/adenosylcobinamide-phosphate guanylyltransferase [Dongiaceae bacterium]